MVDIPHWPKIPVWQIPRKVDLKVTLQLLEALGNHHKKLPPTIHVAGTNGKGSTIAMLKSIFEQGGYKVHRYTSPHLIDFNERIQLAGKNITDSHLHSVLERVRKVSDELNLTPTFFEGTTVAAFLAFSETPADILLLETGLGGRLDCTNVVENPILTIITSISLDHTEYLGEDVLQIAHEKSGIIKKGAPCVIASQSEEIYGILLDKCEDLKSPAFCYDYDYSAKAEGGNFRYQSKKFNIELPAPNLPGDHQTRNASTVIASIMLLNHKFKITIEQIKKGLLSVDWPGRLQLLDRAKTNRLANENTSIYLDGAHNEAGAASLAKWSSENLTGKVYMILGMTRNRDVNAFCKNFCGVIDKGLAVHVESEPSNYSSHVLAQKAKNTGLDFSRSDSLIDAIKTLSELNPGEKSTIIITGSLFLVSDCLKL